jgi:hypothetical protein
LKVQNIKQLYFATNSLTAELNLRTFKMRVITLSEKKINFARIFAKKFESGKSGRLSRQQRSNAGERKSKEKASAELLDESGKLVPWRQLQHTG